jgi:uncharacterized protein YgiB involved in biofilm formation
MMVASCEKSPEELHALYPDLESCLANANPGDDEQLCRQAWAQAEQNWNQTAPRYADKAACEAQHGAAACMEKPAAPGQTALNQAAPGQTAPGQTAPGQPQPTASSGGSFFMPMMAGFLLSRALSGGGMGFGSQPVYRDRNGYSYAGNQRLGVPPAAPGAPSSSAYSRSGPLNGGNWDAAPARPQTAGGGVSRGGFGSTGSRYSTSSGS